MTVSREKESKFTCRFWRFGRWVEVTIDDNLPCLGNQLCFAHCQDQGAFWLPLLEKAYAKLHGCYEALWAGQVADALVDLTGGLVERWCLRSENKSGNENMFSRIVELKDRCAMSCSVLNKKERVGELGELHSYAITDIQNVITKDHKELVLLRLHNPWGRSKWLGSWHKGSDKWTELCSESSRLQSETQEGEFWVEKQEFLKEFDEVTITFPFSHEGRLLNLWTGLPLLYKQQIYGSWIKGQSAGGSRNNVSFSDNPKFWLHVKEQSEVFLALMQMPQDDAEFSDPVHVFFRRTLRPNRTALHAVGLHLWKVEKRKFKLKKTLSSLPLAGTLRHSYNRQLHLCSNLSPGYYLLIPSAFLKDAEGKFLLHILSTGSITLSEIAHSCAVKDQSKNWSDEGGNWKTMELQGQWKKGSNAGGSRNFTSYNLNPSLPFTVPVGASVTRLTLYQQFHLEKLHAIGFHVYLVTSRKNVSSESQEPCASCIPHSYSQEVSKLCVLLPGKYIIVPSTYLPDQEANFTVTIATKIERKTIQSHESLGKTLQEVSLVSVMK
ncbi:hypothetical protein GDO86_009953 [Hymenochirus boettgeri]|uniref:Calpain catalytic domain-containing protein n=1 Tax=Hymenochirus boettgeri TaxID=247094 RepID=A0A8T2JNF6_9PIPI|nr:hypothetical protein GDO86_009953 [Hymenochirus boettgeri]KAG8445004.1 hypothetical protein GDO86_009953 [Hymenochirus boettgeri]